mmetsp:Transcript_22073/g.32043  ORF Transcript_22073/g.32043 Transcript_22073/m.32043 type:complete len:288 (-) Transcript_22073:709-1572(-)
MNRPQVRNQLCGILGCVDGQGLGYDEQGLGELHDGQLLPGGDGGGVRLQGHVQRHLHRTAPRHQRVRVQHPLDDHERIMKGAVHLVQEVLVGPPENQGHTCLSGGALQIDELPVPHPLLRHLLRSAQPGGVKRLVSLHVCHGGDHLAPRGLGNALQVLHLHPPHRHRTRLHKVLHAQVVDAFRGEHDVGPGLQHLEDALLRDVHLALADALHLLHVLAHHRHAHLHLVLLQVEVDAGNLGVAHHRGHTLARPGAVEGVAIDQVALSGALAVALQHVDVAHRMANHRL